MSWVNNCDVREHVKAALESRTDDEFLAAARNIKKKVERLSDSKTTQCQRLLERILDSALHSDKVYFKDCIADLQDWCEARRIYCPLDYEI